jgi:hypothetical protein
VLASLSLNSAIRPCPVEDNLRLKPPEGHQRSLVLLKGITGELHSLH